jgi:STAM-binding protein
MRSFVEAQVQALKSHAVAIEAELPRWSLRDLLHGASQMRISAKHALEESDYESAYVDLARVYVLARSYVERAESTPGPRLADQLDLARRFRDEAVQLLGTVRPELVRRLTDEAARAAAAAAESVRAQTPESPVAAAPVAPSLPVGLSALGSAPSAQQRQPPPSLGQRLQDSRSSGAGVAAPVRPSAPPSASSFTSLLGELRERGSDASRGGQVQPRPHPPPLRDLRPVVLPVSLVDTFEGLSFANTALPPRGIETCSILCGVPSNGTLRMTTLVVPAQTAGPDNCAMTEEGELKLLQLCQTEGLLALGWLHTHPSQDCFMSSLDCHTHCGWQSSLPEAIALVLSPRAAAGKRTGVFRLTDEPRAAGQPAGSTITGLSTIQHCEGTGFHPHPGGVVLTEQCGHVRFEVCPLRVIDQR